MGVLGLHMLSTYYSQNHVKIKGVCNAEYLGDHTLIFQTYRQQGKAFAKHGRAYVSAINGKVGLVRKVPILEKYQEA